MENEKRLIDANALLEFALKRYNKTIIPSDIVSFPAVDAVEVKRCKNCDQLEITGCYGECRKLGRIVKPWDYCSF